MAAISQTIVSNAFSWMQMLQFLLRFHWNLFPTVKLTTFQLGSDNDLASYRRQAIIWTNDGTHICVTRPQWVIGAHWLVCMYKWEIKATRSTRRFRPITIDKQRVLMHRHQGLNVRHGLCHIYMRYLYIYIWVVYNFCLFCCLFIIVTSWYMWCIVWQVASKRKYRHVWLPYGYLLDHATVYTKPL